MKIFYCFSACLERQKSFQTGGKKRFFDGAKIQKKVILIVINTFGMGNFFLSIVMSEYFFS